MYILSTFFFGVMVAILFLLGLGFAYQYISSKIDDLRYPAPGRRIDVGGYKLHIHCTGTGGPSVILEDGHGGFSSFWKLVQDEVQKFTHVCSYDRAGYGWSDESPYKRISQNMVEELHTLLKNAKIRPPYILVGHSFGGMNVRLFANTYPNEVYGIILVDSSCEKGGALSIIEPSLSPVELFKKRLITRIEIYCGLARLQNTYGKNKFLGIQSDFFKLGEVIAKRSTAKALNVFYAEAFNMQENCKKMEKTPNTLQNKPLIVISAGIKWNTHKSYNDAFNDAWDKGQQELIKLSTKAVHLIAERSDHMIYIRQPEIIIEAIRTMVAEVHSLHAAAAATSAINTKA